MQNTDSGRDAAWRRELRDAIPPRERTAIPRATMNMLDPLTRIHTNAEVNQGLTPEQARTEATRCLDCPDPQCVTGCPVGIDIPGFVKNIQRGDDVRALPAVCGRVCPQERQCESKCIYNKMKKQPVAIGWLERFAADSAPAGDGCPRPASNGIRIAVAGSGPAGLSFAGDMARRGYEVTVYEALHQIGGVLKYGIPEFRLPSSVVDKELDALRAHRHRQDPGLRRPPRHGLQRHLRGLRRRPAPIHGHSGREPHQHPLVQRIPDPRESDARRHARLRHSRAARRPRGRGGRR